MPLCAGLQLAAPAVSFCRRSSGTAFIPAVAPRGAVPAQLNSSGSSSVAPRRLAALRVAASSADEGGSTLQQTLASEKQLLLEERREERALAYGSLAVLLGAAGVALAVLPRRCVEFVWAATPTLVVSGLAQSVGAVFILAGIVANCLKQAAEADHLESDTYKRLNLALMWWGLGTATALWLAPQQPLRLSLGLSTALLGATSAHAALTYAETDRRGLSPLYLLRRFLSSLGNLGSYSNNSNSAIYALYAYGLASKATVAGVVAILLDGKLRIMKEGLMLAPLGSLGTSLLPVTGMGYALMAVVLFTLKDAAQRGRLGASTFKALNIGVAVVSLVNAVRLASWMQGGVLVKSQFAALKIAAPAFLAVVALYNYMFAAKKKA